MAGWHRFWNDVWPVLTSFTVVGSPWFAWQHWRISVKLSRHEIQVTAMLEKRLRVKVEVDSSAEAVTITPVPPLPPAGPGLSEGSEPQQ
jgi:hypothetical protein